MDVEDEAGAQDVDERSNDELDRFLKWAFDQGMVLNDNVMLLTQITFISWNHMLLWSYLEDDDVDMVALSGIDGINYGNSNSTFTSDK